MKLLIVVEKSGKGYSAFAPDVPGCIAAGRSREETERLMREALEFHLESLRQDGLPVPPPESYATYVEVAA